MESRGTFRLYLEGRSDGFMFPGAENLDMTRFLAALLALLTIAASVSRPAAPPSTAVGPGVVLGTTPLLSIREVEEVSPGLIVMMPESTPERRPGLFFLRVNVRVPCTELVFVPKTTRVKRMRLVYRPVERKVVGDVFVPLTVHEKKLQIVYREQKREDAPQPVYVPHKVNQFRPVYRKVTRQVPCTQDVYVPIVSRQKKTIMAYVAESVKITRTVPDIRMESASVRDPATGKMVMVEKPVCRHRQVTETVNRYVLRPRVIEEEVTSYRLERRTHRRTVDEYVLEHRLVNETAYHLEIRRLPEAVAHYVARPEVVDDTVTKYRLEHHLRETVTDYIPEWRVVEEEVTTYSLEARNGLRSVERYIPCHGEIIVPSTRMQPVPIMRKTWLVEPLTTGPLPSCVMASGGGFSAACGAIAQAPVLTARPDPTSP
jgi:hypothetical protein